ncbi:hypothetical protein BDV95DRAFT_606290 [Massariosphaeria phaeospora]|uniref:Uncharacterized protein n=1 Tax=Massariosphaeria phaeospora TaxID=100035 RepID=A0A7C8MQR6_9PLEO|nr:hypothetical protein BDV95DRAFT_606290 [Massariosphaeria phaeospora]
MLLPLPLIFPLILFPALTHTIPSPPLVPPSSIHLMPHNTLFLRQLSSLQTFTAALGGTSAPPITDSGDAQRPFEVDGDTFTDFAAAAQRSCDRQFDGCQRGANGSGGGGGEGVKECEGQRDECNSAQQSAPVKDFQGGGAVVASTNIGPDPEFPDYDLICEA